MHLQNLQLSRPRRTTRAVGWHRALCALAAVFLLPVLPSLAQSVCQSEALANPQRQVVTCGGGFRMELEASARVTIFTRSDGSAPRLVELDGGGALIETGPEGGRSQIRTPHAIAAVRGTQYIVDVSASQTSVFVAEGLVEVRGNDASIGRVQLAQGQGVDVTGAQLLDVQNWPAERVAEVLARFGR